MNLMKGLFTREYLTDTRLTINYPKVKLLVLQVHELTIGIGHLGHNTSNRDQSNSLSISSL